jgi:amino acid adenylation domain-containing protein
MVLASRLAPQRGLYVIQDVCESSEELDAELLQRAWRGVADRHPALVTSFVTGAGGDLRQRVTEGPEMSWQELDWTTVTPDEKTDRLTAFLRQDWERGFDFDAGIPMRFALLRLPHRASILIWTIHHALLDGRSLAIVWREWFAFYDALVRDKPVRLADAAPFHEHAGRLLHQDLAEAERYWRQRYAGFSGTNESIVDPLRHRARGHDGFAKESMCLSAEDTGALWEFASRHGLKVHNLVQGAWALLLARYSGRQDVVFGVTRAGRHASVPGAGEMVGLLMNTLPFPTTVDPRAEVLPWLKEIGEQWAGLLAYEHTPLEKIREWSGLPPGTPLFDSILVYDHEAPSELPRQIGGSWGGRTLHRVQRTGVPLTLVAYGRPLVKLEIVYDEQLFSREIASGMVRHLHTLLRSCLARPGAPLAAVKMLDAPEEAWLVTGVNRTEAALDENLSVHRLFENQAAQAPEKVALEFEASGISYGELNRRANQLAHLLRGRGAGPEDLIAICMGRRPNSVVAVLAVLKAGAAFLSLDPSLPPGRLAQMIEGARPKLVLVWGGAGTGLASGGYELVDVDGLRSKLTQLPADDLPHGETPFTAAYASYTSGSSGAPKAAILTHGALLNHTLAAARVYGITHRDRRLQFASPGSDMFVAEVFNYLCNGATLVFYPQARGVSVAEFWRVLEELRITVTGVPSSWWNEWVSAISAGAWVPPPALRAVVTGMEQVSPTAFLKWKETVGSRVRLFNAYGPSEASPTTTIYEAGTSDWEGGAFVPIGKPIANVKAYVLDSDRNPVPMGVPGELYIGGTGLARGYLKAPDLTAERFVPDRLGVAPGGRLYRTGDRVFRLPDGNLAFLGRLDRQVKIRGFRVELDEVETVLGRHPGVRQCAVVAQGPEGRQTLVAYVAPARGLTLDRGELRQHLCRQMPEHMVPVAFAVLAELPRTSSGKVDRLSLPALAPEPPPSVASHRQPETEMEQRLAELWRRVLGVPAASANDNFFLAGGDSLRAAELLALIHKEFDLEMPMAALLRAPTIAGLAAAHGHDNPKAPAPEDLILCFNENGARPPLFCISSQGDDAQCFRHLAAHLGPDRPLFAMAGPDGNDRLGDMEDTARRACQSIRRLRPHGPYLLGGYCFGGIVAFETARQLIAMGAEVPLVALFDVPAPGHPRFLRAFGRRLRVLKPAGVPLVHFTARRDESAGARILHLLADPRRGWRHLIGKPVQIVRVDGTHSTLLHEPHAAIIAASLEALAGEAHHDAAPPEANPRPHDMMRAV